MMCKHCGQVGGHTAECGYFRTLEKLLYETNRFFWSRAEEADAARDRLRAAWVDAEHYHDTRHQPVPPSQASGLGGAPYGGEEW